ncbi:MAG TPA: SRPBCC domain-containing protein [Terracidiphilus sp.]|jgi:uncharacterized protein YndB with AHSA1/START domain|nr:SRPBCC domain-containing protein [Terracidiphilus sp.]
MEQPKVVHSTFVVERSIPKPPQTVFAAFSDPAKMRRWYGEGDGHNVEEFTSDFRVGGVQTLHYRLKEGTPVAGMTIKNEGRFQEIQPNQRIVTVSTMDLSGKRILASQVTIELLPNGDGTDLILTHQGAFFEGGLAPEMLEAGWRTLLEKLALELER